MGYCNEQLFMIDYCWIRYTYNLLTDMPNTVDSNTNNKWHTGFYSQMKLFPKRSWTSEEDELLISIVDKLGA